jgi:hypothetical protein
MSDENFTLANVEELLAAAVAHSQALSEQRMDARLAQSEQLADARTTTHAAKVKQATVFEAAVALHASGHPGFQNEDVCVSISMSLWRKVELELNQPEPK